MRRSARLARVELLESRTLMSLLAQGSEFHVNTYTSLAQENAAVAADQDGDFVIVWESFQESGGGPGIYAQRYNAAGVAQGSEIHVNTFTTNSQTLPAVAIDADGDFVVVWTSNDVTNGGVRGQRFNASGVPQGTEFSATTTGTAPAVAMDSAGNFVVTWSATDGSGTGIFANRYNSSGVQQGSQIAANTYTFNAQARPAVAMDTDGDFVIAWDSDGQDLGQYGIFARRFDSAGTGQGSEFQVNTYTTNNQRFASVAVDLAGNFVIAWTSEGQALVADVYARRYNAAGTAQGSEFLVNTYTTGGQSLPSVAMDGGGDFTIAWNSNLQDGSAYGVYALQFSAIGAPQGSEFLVNTYTTTSQYNPAAAAAEQGNVIIAWTSQFQEVLGMTGIYAQRFAETVDTSGPDVTGVFTGSQQVQSYFAYQGPITQLVVAFSQELSTTGGTGGANSVTNPANWLITRNGVDSMPQSVAFGFNATTLRYEATVTLAGGSQYGNFQLKIRDNVRDTLGYALDGNGDLTPGGAYVLPFSIAGGLVGGQEAMANTYTTGSQSFPIAEMDNEGNTLVIWDSVSFVSPGQQGTYARRYISSGGTVGTEFRVGHDVYSMAMDGAGNFVTVYLPQSGNSYIGFDRFDSSGQLLGSDFAATGGTFWTTDIAMDNAGNFAVAYWNPFTGIWVRMFTSAGVGGSPVLVQAPGTMQPQHPAIAMDEEGDFVVVWTQSPAPGRYELFAQRYSAGGTIQGSEFRVSVPSDTNLGYADVAMDSDGDFVFTWNNGDDRNVYARRFDKLGVPQGAPFRVSGNAPGWQYASRVAMDDAGDFVLTWTRDEPAPSVSDIWARQYSADGTPVSDEFLVNGYTTGSQENPSVAFNDAGNIFVIAWDSGSNAVNHDVFNRRFTTSGFTPAVSLLSDAPDPVTRGNSLTLTASSISSERGIASVSFYRETNGLPGLQVGSEGDTLVGTDADSGGGWSLTFSTLSLNPGSHTFWAQVTDLAGFTGYAATTSTTVVTSNGPLVINSSFHYDTLPQKLRFTFDRDVSGNNPGSISLADLTLQKIGGGAVPALTMLAYGTDGTNVVTFTMNTQLTDGNYRATISAAGVTDPVSMAPMAADYVFDFFILAGDANHDRRVDVNDITILAANWLGTGKAFSQGDFDGDGDVDAHDLGIMAIHWQQTLAQPAPPLPAAPVSARPPSRTAARTPTRVIDLVQ